MILPFSGKLSAGAAHVCATMSQSLKAVAITFDSNILRTSRLCYKRQSQTSLLLAADRIKKITFFPILHRQNLALSLQRSTTNIPVFDTLGWGVATRMNGSHRGEFT